MSCQGHTLSTRLRTTDVNCDDQVERVGQISLTKKLLWELLTLSVMYSGGKSVRMTVLREWSARSDFLESGVATTFLHNFFCMQSCLLSPIYLFNY